MAKAAVVKVVKALARRLKEPSSWAGLGLIAMAFGVDAEQVRAVVSVAGVLFDTPGIGEAVTAVAGAAAVFLPEKKQNDGA